MKMRIWISAAGLALAGSLLAQTGQDVQAVQELVQKITDDILTLPVAWEAPLVSGHPYSATAREVTLSPDGAHIDRSHSEMVYRDDQGRTRREPESDKRVTILDPTAGITYTLDPERKIATKRTMAPRAFEPQTRVPAQSPLEIATAQAKGRPNMNVEDLGTQVVNGVAAQGVRVTTLIPIGSIGNDRELKTVLDRWISPDLHVLVKSVTTDSRSGTFKYDLTNLILASPDPSLFQVPAGYTVEETAGRGGRGASAPIQFQPSTKK